MTVPRYPRVVIDTSTCYDKLGVIARVKQALFFQGHASGEALLDFETAAMNAPHHEALLDVCRQWVRVEP